MTSTKSSLSDDCTPERIDYWKQYISFVWGADGDVNCCTQVRKIGFILLAGSLIGFHFYQRRRAGQWLTLTQSEGWRGGGEYFLSWEHLLDNLCVDVRDRDRGCTEPPSCHGVQFWGQN